MDRVMGEGTGMNLACSGGRSLGLSQTHGQCSKAQWRVLGSIPSILRHRVGVLRFGTMPFLQLQVGLALL
jgi:hypothetical protein